MLKQIPKEIVKLAGRFSWYEEPKVLLEDQNRFLVFAMAHIPEEVFEPLFQFYTRQDFIDALYSAPPGILLTKEEWLYWNNKFAIIPPLPFPMPAVMNKAS